MAGHQQDSDEMTVPFKSITISLLKNDFGLPSVAKNFLNVALKKKGKTFSFDKTKLATMIPSPLELRSCECSIQHYSLFSKIEIKWASSPEIWVCEYDRSVSVSASAFYLSMSQSISTLFGTFPDILNVQHKSSSLPSSPISSNSNRNFSTDVFWENFKRTSTTTSTSTNSNSQQPHKSQSMTNLQMFQDSFFPKSQTSMKLNMHVESIEKQLKQMKVDLADVEQIQGNLLEKEREISDLKKANELLLKNQTLAKKENEEKISQLEKKIQQAEDRSKCVICVDKHRDTVLLPCSHFSCCDSCIAQHLARSNTCPICRAPVSGRFQARLEM